MRRIFETVTMSCAFTAFSGFLGKTSAATRVLKLTSIGALIFSSLQAVVEEYNKPSRLESTWGRIFRIGNPAAKIAVLGYSACIDILLDTIGNDYEQIIVQPAFALFSLILWHRGTMAQDKCSGRLLFAISIANTAAMVGLRLENESVTMISLLTAAGVNLFRLVPDSKAYQAARKEQEQELKEGANSFLRDSLRSYSNSSGTADSQHLNDDDEFRLRSLSRTIP